MKKFVLGLLLRIAVFGLTIFYVSLVIKAYFESDFEFPIIKSILSTIVIIIWSNHCFAVVWVGFVGFYIMSLHLKYNFRQLKVIMKRSLKSRNLDLLMDVIQKHNHYSELTLQYNKLFKYILALVYFITVPVINILVYMTTYEVNFLLPIFYSLITINFSILAFIANYISSSLSSSAHDFTSDLYSFLFSSRLNIAVQLRLKITSFIEKLCGPVIGYYCYNLFAFTNYEFYEYVSFFSAIIFF